MDEANIRKIVREEIAESRRAAETENRRVQIEVAAVATRYANEAVARACQAERLLRL